MYVIAEVKLNFSVVNWNEKYTGHITALLSEFRFEYPAYFVLRQCARLWGVMCEHVRVQLLKQRLKNTKRMKQK